MSRTLTFEIITDTRRSLYSFGDDKSHLDKTVTIIGHLRQLPGVTVDIGPTTRPHFGDTMQWRSRFWVRKNRETTWETVMRTVNKTQAPRYKFQ